MALTDASGLPLAVCAASASLHEDTLVEAALAASFLRERPERLIADRAYDSDPLDAENGIELIVPHKRNRKKARTRDSCKLRRYKRRRKIERLFAWLGNFRALYSATSGAENYLGFMKLGCLVILPRYL